MRPTFVVRGGFGISRYAQDYASGAMNLYNPPFVPLNLDCFPQTGTGASACPAGSGRLFQGAPPVTIPVINNQLPGTVGAHAVDYPQAYIMQWNLTFQKQVGANVFQRGVCQPGGPPLALRSEYQHSAAQPARPGSLQPAGV